jgi:hypothetical protein
VKQTLKELDNLVGTRDLQLEAFSQAEFEGLVESGSRRLQDAQKTDLSLESRFDLAYNAAHALALAALRFHGYRPRNRYIAFQCLTHTVKLPPGKWRVLSHAHNKRNLGEYEGDFDIDIALVESLVRVVLEVQSLVRSLGPAVP